MLSVQIRKAERKDIDGILSIYNEEVENGIATLATEPMTPEDGMRWLAEHEGGNRCAFVAVLDGQVVGYVSLSRFSPRGGYDRTAELSIYVAKPFRGQGIAGQLMASRNLHEKFGFRHIGRLKEAGWKFGIALDVDYYERMV